MAGKDVEEGVQHTQSGDFPVTLAFVAQLGVVNVWINAPEVYTRFDCTD